MALAGANRSNHDIMKLRRRAIRSDLPSVSFLLCCPAASASFHSLYLPHSASPFPPVPPELDSCVWACVGFVFLSYSDEHF